MSTTQMGGALPPAQSASERDSARMVLGQAYTVLGKELLSPQPDGLKLRMAQKAVAQIQSVLATGTAEKQAMSSQGQFPGPQTGRAEPVRQKSSATTRGEMSTPF